MRKLTILVITAILAFSVFTKIIDNANACTAYPDNNCNRMFDGVGNYGDRPRNYWVSASFPSSYTNYVSIGVDKWNDVEGTKNGVSVRSPVQINSISYSYDSKFDVYYSTTTNPNTSGETFFYNFYGSQTTFTGQSNWSWAKIYAYSAGFDSKSSSWKPAIIAHEFGHAFGFAHSNIWGWYGSIMEDGSNMNVVNPSLSDVNALIHHLYTNPYSDVDRSSIYFDGISYCCETGVMIGTSNTGFSPSSNITREDAVICLARMYKKEYNTLGSPAAHGFVDVPKESDIPISDPQRRAYISEANLSISWAKANGIVNGTSATTFGWEQSVTRQDYMTFIYRYSMAAFGANISAISSSITGNSIGGYTGIPIYAQPGVLLCAQGRIIHEDVLGSFNPGGVIKREQAAYALAAYMQIHMNMGIT